MTNKYVLGSAAIAVLVVAFLLISYFMFPGLLPWSSQTTKTQGVTIPLSTGGPATSAQPTSTGTPSGTTAGVTVGSTAKETVERAILNFAGLKMVKADSTMEAAVLAEATTGKTVAMVMTTNGKSIADLENRKAKAEATFSISFGGTIIECKQAQTTTQVTAESYIIGDTIYTNAGQGWTKTTKAGIFDLQTMNARNIGFTENVDIRQTGTETIDGVKTTVFEYRPDMSAISDLLGDETLKSAISELGGGADTTLADLVKEALLKVWIDDEGYARRYYTRMVMETQGIGESVKSMSITVEITTNLKDFNAPVVIELPAEAANAQEITTTAPTQ